MGTKAAASLARGPSSSQPLAGRVPSREISLGAMPRQSSAPQTPNISARCGSYCPGSWTPINPDTGPATSCLFAPPLASS